MRILLNGGLGFIGKRFISRCRHDDELVIYARVQDTAAAEEIRSDAVIATEYGSAEGERLAEVIDGYRPDAIVHLAALTGLEKCRRDPVTAFRSNVFGTYNMLHGCLDARPKIVFMSSREVYGDTAPGVPSKESDPLAPNNVYGITKMLAESLVRLFSQMHGLDHTILRLTNVYGPQGDRYGAQTIIRDALDGGVVNVMGGDQRLNFVFVDDVVDVINCVLGEPRAARSTYNVGSCDTLTIDEFVGRVAALIPGGVKVRHMPMRETETSNFEPDLESLEALMGGVKRTTLEEGLQKTIEWYRQDQNRK